jgi:hypothetical protein
MSTNLCTHRGFPTVIKNGKILCQGCQGVVGNLLDVEYKKLKKSDTHDIVTPGKIGKRSKRSFRYDLVDKGYQKRITNNLEFGLLKYNGDKEVPIVNENWVKAVDNWDTAFILEALLHLKDHVLELLELVPHVLHIVDEDPNANRAFRIKDLIKAKPEDDIAHASFNLMILSRFMDNLGYNAEYWRPIYEKRIEELKAAKNDNNPSK